MFEYDLKGKSVILSLDPEFLQHVRLYGIDGSPLFAKVYEEESDGLWLETTSFALCPRGVPSLYDAQGSKRCRAHIFIPAKAIVSVVTFPAEMPPLEQEPDLFQIGFRPQPREKNGEAGS